MAKKEFQAAEIEDPVAVEPGPAIVVPDSEESLVKGVAVLRYLGRRPNYQISFKIDGVMTCFCFDRKFDGKNAVCFIPDPEHSFTYVDEEEERKVKTTVVDYLMSMTEKVDEMRLPRFERLR